MNLGNILKEIRKKKGLTQMELADFCEITQTYLSQIEQNKKEANTATLKKIAEKLEIPLPILFFLSLDSKDVPENKREAFNTIAPSVNALIKTFFTND